MCGQKAPGGVQRLMNVQLGLVVACAHQRDSEDRLGTGTEWSVE